MDPKFGMKSLTPSDTVQLFLLAKAVQAQCGITSTETARTLRDGEPTTAISTFTQLLSSDKGRFSVALRPQKPSGLLGTGSPWRTPRLSNSF